jgi:hypothetical protein
VRSLAGWCRKFDQLFTQLFCRLKGERMYRLRVDTRRAGCDDAALVGHRGCSRPIMQSSHRIICDRMVALLPASPSPFSTPTIWRHCCALV